MFNYIFCYSISVQLHCFLIFNIKVLKRNCNSNCGVVNCTRTKDFIFWPSKRTISDPLLKTFKKKTLFFVVA